jgi:predicted nucleotidyltransferase
MNLSHPAFDLFGENEGRVLHRLAVLAEGASGRRIHVLSGVNSLRTTQGILEKFARAGIVTVRALGNSHEYILNRDHALWPPIREILELPASVEQEIGRILARAFDKRVAGAALYGSFARGDANPTSDVDILILLAEGNLAPDLVDAIDSVSNEIQKLTGNEAQILPMSKKELLRLVDQKDPLIESLRADARPLTDAFDLEGLLRRGRE